MVHTTNKMAKKNAAGPQAGSENSESSHPQKNSGRSSGKSGNLNLRKNSKGNSGKKSQGTTQKNARAKNAASKRSKKAAGSSSKNSLKKQAEGSGAICSICNASVGVCEHTQTIANVKTADTQHTNWQGDSGQTTQNASQIDDLSPKQEMFCREYLIDLNATQAAIRAGYSKQTAYSIGSENLKKPEVQRRISSLQAERAKRVDVTQDMVLAELFKIAFANVKEYLSISEDGRTLFIEWDEVESDKTAAISEVTTVMLPGGGWKSKIKMHDKMEALKLIGQHLGMFKIGIDATTGGKAFANSFDLSQLSEVQLTALLPILQQLQPQKK